MRVLHYGLRCVSEVYPFKKGIAKSFQKCVEVPFNLECNDFCNTLIDDNYHLS
jgi:hypothetical protein